jgi:hypothetical protein
MAEQPNSASDPDQPTEPDYLAEPEPLEARTRTLIRPGPPPDIDDPPPF